MAAESHKELQKTGRFGDWARKDIQYSQFQNFELTYAHFIRFPSWERSPPGSSPGVNWGLEPQCMERSFYVVNLILTFLLIISILISPPRKCNIVPPFENLNILKNANYGTFLYFPKPIMYWTASLAISWLILANYRQSIQNRLICAQWKSKISWWNISKFYEKNIFEINDIFLQFKTFHQYYFIGMRITQETSCDRWLDSTTNIIEKERREGIRNIHKCKQKANISWLFSNVYNKLLISVFHYENVNIQLKSADLLPHKTLHYFTYPSIISWYWQMKFYKKLVICMNLPLGFSFSMITSYQILEIKDAQIIIRCHIIF